MADRLRKKSTAELKRMNKEELVAAVTELINSEGVDVSNAAILEEVRGMRKDFDDHLLSVNESVRELSETSKKTVEEVSELKKSVNLQKDTLLNQQIAIEQLFARERAANVIIYGLKEDTGISDKELIGLMSAVVEVEDIPTVFKRIGTSGTRPILITCDGANQRKSLLENSKKLKIAGEKEYENGVKINWKDVFIKKDVHPAIRKEWGRLRTVEKNEKAKPENEGCEIKLDNSTRQVLRDGIVIDSWKMNFL